VSPKEYGVEMWHGFKSGSSEEPLAGFLNKKSLQQKCRCRSVMCSM